MTIPCYSFSQIDCSFGYQDGALGQGGEGSLVINIQCLGAASVGSSASTTTTTACASAIARSTTTTTTTLRAFESSLDFEIDLFFLL